MKQELIILTVGTAFCVNITLILNKYCTRYTWDIFLIYTNIEGVYNKVDLSTDALCVILDITFEILPFKP